MSFDINYIYISMKGFFISITFMLFCDLRLSLSTLTDY